MYLWRCAAQKPIARKKTKLPEIELGSTHDPGSLETCRSPEIPSEFFVMGFITARVLLFLFRASQGDRVEQSRTRTLLGQLIPGISEWADSQGKTAAADAAAELIA
jgi:hypothetical protein